MSDEKYCKDCKNMNCPESRVNCKHPDAIACDLYRDTQQTVFEAITQSPEMLAPLLVREYWIEDGPHIVKMWVSKIVPDHKYKTEAKAITATVARLKEVYNENVLKKLD